VKDRLIYMLQAQKDLQSRYRDGDPWTMTTDEHRIAFMSEQFGNIIHELVEARDEATWKSWHEGPLRINAEMGIKELVDAWHFMMNWLLCLGPLVGCESVEDLANFFTDEYAKKNQVNHERKSSGNYDGFTDKCHNCGRHLELAEWQEEELKDMGGTMNVLMRYLVCPCGQVLDSERRNQQGEIIG